ncbi:MAG: hypothetical protein U0359_37925 [Byssovorax sp.]
MDLPNEPPRRPWAAPALIAAAVAALLVYRAVAGRDEPALSPGMPVAGGSVLPPPSADLPASVIVPPRCAEIGAEPFVIGEPPRKASAPRPAASAQPGGTGADPLRDPLDDEPEDELAPFAVEIGRGAVLDGGFAAGVRRDAEGGALSMVAMIGIDGKDGRLVKLGRSRGDLDPPVVAGAGSAALAALVEPNAGGRAIKIAKIAGGEVTWGVELSEGRDESTALDLAASGARGVVVWDDLGPSEKRSQILLASFDLATLRSVTGARPVSSPRLDADSPRLVPRPGGYWLAYIARNEEKKAAPAANKPGGKPKKDPQRDLDRGREDDDETGEIVTTSWLEILPLDENAAPAAEPRAVTPKNGNVLSFDLELADDGAALLAFRDDDTPMGSSGGRISAVHVQLGGAIETHVLAEESLGAGVPDLLPGWLSVSGVSGVTKLAPVDGKGALTGPFAPEQSLGQGEPIAATKEAILLARPAGKAMRLSLMRCSTARDPKPADPPK